MRHSRPIGGQRPIVLLDEYDTPMQEAWLGGYWDDMAVFMRSLFNSTFKTNASLGRALMTGVTRVSQESIFSDLNNLSVATLTTPKYETAFGFTEEEVFAALDEFGLDIREDVRSLYDRRWDGEESLQDTLANAKEQFDARSYVTQLVECGIAPERIHAYGIAFRGKDVLVG